MRGLESDPLPPPRSDDAAADPAWWEVHSGPAPAKGDPEDGALPGRHRRARWGELPRDGANGDAPGARVVKKENRDPSTPSPESESRASPPAGRLMPWEQQMLIERAEREAAAKGLPPTPSKEVIARAFGEEEPDEGRDPDVWAPPPPPPASSARNNPTTSATAALAARRAKEAKAREEANERAKEAKEAREKAKKPPAEKDQSDADRRRIEGGSSRAANRREPPPPSSNAGPVGAAPAEATVVRAAPVPDRKKPVGGGSRPTSARPATSRPGSARRSPYAAAAVPGFAAAHEKQTRAAAIKPVDPRPVGAPVEQQRSERTEKKQHAPGPGSTPAVARAAAAASAEILGALSPEPTKPKPAVAADSALAADAAQEDLFPVHVVSRGEEPRPSRTTSASSAAPATASDAPEEEEAGEVALLLGAFAQRAAAVSRGEASPSALDGASPDPGEAERRRREVETDARERRERAAREEEMKAREAELRAREEEMKAREKDLEAREAAAAAAAAAGERKAAAEREQATAAAALDRAVGGERRTAPAPPPGLVVKTQSKKPRLPSEMVAKIVEKAAEKLPSPGEKPAGRDRDRATPPASPTAARLTRSPRPASATAHAPAGAPMGFDEFLRLQEASGVAPGKSPKKQPGFASGPSSAAVASAFDGSSVDPAAAAAAKRKIALAKAPKRPTAAAAPLGGGPALEDVVVMAKKVKDAGDKMTRQMFDKRESRRMNAKPFAAAVQRWRNRRAARAEQASSAPTGTAPAAASRPPSPPGGGSVKVYVRKRPLFAHEQARGEFDCVTVPAPSPGSVAPADSTEIVIHNCQMHADLKRMFVKHSAFDVTRAFGEAADSEEVYRVAAAPMVAGALSGRVGALFMYGQTGSGKTHTMEAIEQTATRALFRGDPDQALPGAVSVRVAYFEIAGKRCTDLLSPSRPEIALKEVGGGAIGAGAGAPMDASEYRKLDVQLIGAVEPEVRTANELEAIIAAGKSRRATSATHCNAASSRSHAVLRLTCVLKNGGGLTGRLTLVDCAGSERKEDNVHHSAEQRKETAEINASLYALKECVRMRKMQHQRFGQPGASAPGAGTGGGHVHVPYRSSHLTRVLMECFVRPDAQLGVIGTVSPASTDTEHSVSTLKTVGLIGGGEDGEGATETKEDVSRNLEMDDDGVVTEAVVERVVAPVRWSNAHIKAWLQKPGQEKFAARVNVPPSLVGRDIVRMSAMALQKICGGDKKLAEALHNKLRDEIARCSSKNR